MTRPGPSVPDSERVRATAVAWADALAYALVVVAVTTVVALVVAVATGGGLVRAKVVLFLAGFGLMGYSIVRLWPSKPADLEGSLAGYEGTAGDAVPAAADRTRFQAFVRALPPARWLPRPSPKRRIQPAGKLFWASLGVFFVSYLMEAAFGVA